MKFNVEELKFDKNGLIPVIAQDEKTAKIMMLAYMNKESLKKTIETKKACYFSRSRQKLWIKGEVSGNIQEVKDIFVDCDNDAIVIKINQIGGSACHTGYETCFYRKVDASGNFEICNKKIFDPKEVYGK